MILKKERLSKDYYSAKLDTKWNFFALKENDQKTISVTTKKRHTMIPHDICISAMNYLNG